MKQLRENWFLYPEELQFEPEPPPFKAWPVVWMIVGLAVGGLIVRFAS